MRIALIATLALLAVQAVAQTSPLEDWTRAQQGPPPPIRTRVDSLVVAEDVRDVFIHATPIMAWMPGGTFCRSEPSMLSDSLTWTCDWQRYVALPAIGRTAEEFFVANPGTKPPSALAPRVYQPQHYDRIDYRLVVTAKKLPPAKRNGPERTLVTASAQFIGFQHFDEPALAEPIEIESSGLIERDFFARLRAKLERR